MIVLFKCRRHFCGFKAGSLEMDTKNNRNKGPQGLTILPLSQYNIFGRVLLWIVVVMVTANIAYICVLRFLEVIGFGEILLLKGILFLMGYVIIKTTTKENVSKD